MATKKRLIDVNKVINAMQKCLDESPYSKGSIAHFTFEAIITALKKEPTVDAVEVVRCKDCVHYDLFLLSCRNGYMNGTIGIEGFCSYGERKDNA